MILQLLSNLNDFGILCSGGKRVECESNKESIPGEQKFYILS